MAQGPIDFSTIDTKSASTEIKVAPLKDSRFYAFGSWHGHNSTFRLFVAYFKQLYLKSNVRVVFIENSYSEGILLNHYLKTGEKDRYLCFFGYKNDFQYLYEPLRVFNASLPDTEKITIVGVDRSFIPGFPDVLSAIQLLLSKDKLPDIKIKNMVDSLLSFNFLEYNAKKELPVLLDQFCISFYRNKRLYYEYLDSNYETLQNVLSQYKLSKQLPDVNYNNCDSLSFDVREDFIYNNLKHEILLRPNVNYIGLFGWAHTYLNKTRDVHTFQIKTKENFNYYSFIARLNKESDSPVKNSVCAISVQEGMLIFRNALKKILGKDVFKQVIRQSKRGSIYLFDFFKSTGYEEFAKNNFQYLILVR